MSALVDFANSTVAVIRPRFGVIAGSNTVTVSKRKSIATSTFVGVIAFAIAASMVGVIFLQALVAKSVPKSRIITTAHSLSCRKSFADAARC